MRKTDLVIVGGGAAGLMAGCAAGELGLKAMVLERKHKPGRKLLMCGNARCNLTTNISDERMLEMFGDPVGPFLGPAIRAFSPSMLQRWFALKGLKTVVKAGNKVYPHTEQASDVLNLFTDVLRDGGVTLACSAVVEGLVAVDGGFRVDADNFSVEATHVLVATGGLSYPKTGSVGDGYRWASALGHGLVECRPGLVGFEVDGSVLKGRVGQIHERVGVEIVSRGKVVAETRGVYEIESWGIGGTAITDASRIVARRRLDGLVLRIRFEDGHVEEVAPRGTRPLKEAMVTIGGVALDGIDPKSMESRHVPGLYFAGEVLDIDGPTGGYNLQAAFSTARLAVASIGQRLGRKPCVVPVREPSVRSAGRPQTVRKGAGRSGGNRRRKGNRDG